MHPHTAVREGQAVGGGQGRKRDVVGSAETRVRSLFARLRLYRDE